MGFIDLDKYKTSERVSKIALCGKCKLNKGCIFPNMLPTGDGEKGILIVAEAPGKQEDKRNIQLIGKAGKTLRKVLKVKDIDLDIDCRKINSVNCRPPKNRNPTAAEIKCCRPNVWKEIESFKPKVIILLGTVAIESVIGHMWKKNLGGVTKWRGWTIPDRELKAWICPTYHPSYLNYENNPVLKKIFKKDIETALSMRNYDLPVFEDEKKQVKIIKGSWEIIKALHEIIRNEPELISYDYETTGLKPHAKGHEIVTCSISVSPDEAIAFPVWGSNKVKSLLRDILRNPNIKKIAANLKFEETWNRNKLRIKSSGWVWDTMIAAHVLDNRRSITSLKFQTYIRYGVADYDSHLNSHLEANSDEEGANALNDIHKIDMDDLLLYNGLDSLFEHRLALDQMKEFGIIDPMEYIKTGRIANDRNIHEEDKPPRKIKRR